jgi:hypothetical protein
MVKLFGRTCNRIIVAVRQSLAQSFAETRVNASRGKRRALSAGRSPFNTRSRKSATTPLRENIRGVEYARRYDFSGAKNRIVRASILSRGAALGGEVGSSKPEWAVNRVRFSSESKHLSSNASSVRIRGK